MNVATLSLLTRSVEHNQGGRMFLQEAVKGLVSQVEDRRVRLRPGHLGGLWLRRLRTGTQIENMEKNSFFLHEQTKMGVTLTLKTQSEKRTNQKQL